MSKMILEKNSSRPRGFVSPSASTDIDHSQATSTVASMIPAMDWKVKTGLGLVVGAWALTKFPKTTILGAIAYGLYAGMKGQKSSGGKNPFQGEGIVKDLLH